MGEYECEKCHVIFDTKQSLERHLVRKNPCQSGQFDCNKCGKKFKDNSARYRHQKACHGKRQSIAEKNEKIESLKSALAATNGLNIEINAKQQKIINNNTTNNITINDIKNITQNIVIMPVGSENIDHLKRMSMEELKEKIHFDRDPSTHIEAFKLIRLDPEHPENHNILLTEKDSDKVIFLADDKGWQEGNYTYQVRNAIFDTNKSIGGLIPFKERETSDYYWSHLVRGIGGACNERNDAVLKPIFDGMREPLHQATLRLMNISQSDGDRQDMSIAQSEETALLIAKEKTRQLELELEIEKVKSKRSCP